MSNWKIKLSVFLNYFVFAILLNSVGTVILQVQIHYGVSESVASYLEACKDLSIAFVSFLIAAYIVRIGYKRAMLCALGFITAACLLMPAGDSFRTTELLFAATGASFAVVKVSVFATLGLVAPDRREHASLMNFLESFFMVGILSGYFVFGAFTNDSNIHSSSWLRVYFLLAGVALAALILLAGTDLDESRIFKAERPAFWTEFTGMFRLAVTPLTLVFIASVFTYVLIEQGIMSWLPTFNSKVLHLPTSLSIRMAGILAASTAIGRLIAGFVLRKVRWFPVALVCLLSAAALVLLTLPLADSASSTPAAVWMGAPLAAFVFPLIGFFIAPIYPVINSVVLSALPVRQHGAMSGLIVVFSALGGTTGSIITGHMFQIFGGQMAFRLSLAPIGALIVFLFIFDRIRTVATAPCL